MPTVVLAALWLSIILVLGILVSWEYKRYINKRRMKLPTDL
jgi:preprotein translocase subunit SecG